MAKRVRGSRSTHLPGGKGPTRSRKTADGSTSPAEDAAREGATLDLEPIDASYSEVEVDEIAASAVAATTAPAPAPAPVESKRRRRAQRQAKSRPADLAARAAAEDVWVREDIRRIGVVSLILIIALALAWVVFVALDVLSLY